MPAYPVRLVPLLLLRTGQHLLMQGAGRLFHRVIMQSNPFSYHYRSLTVANFLGQAVKRGIDCQVGRLAGEQRQQTWVLFSM